MPPQTLFAAITPKALVVASHAAATVFITATAVAALLLLLLLLAMPGAAVADAPVEPARPIPWNVAVAALAAACCAVAVGSLQFASKADVA